MKKLIKPFKKLFIHIGIKYGDYMYYSIIDIGHYLGKKFKLFFKHVLDYLLIFYFFISHISYHN